MSRGTSWGRRVAGLALATAAVGGVALPAVATTQPAEPTGEIVGQVNVAAGFVDFVFTASGLSDGVTLDAESVEVRLAGQAVESTVAPFGENAAAPARRAIIAMDVSGSMTQRGLIEPAKQSAITFLDSLPSDVEVGLVTFGNAASVAVAPTAQREEVRSRIVALTATDALTALYNGVIEAVGAAETDGVRQVVLLSDGDNDPPEESPNAAIATVSGAGVQVNALALQGSNPETLAALTVPSGGQVIPANNQTLLTAGFAQQAQAISEQLEVQAAVPPAAAGRPNVLLVTAVTSDEQDVSYSTTIETLPVATPSPTASPTPTSTELPPLDAAPGPGLFDRTANLWLVLALLAVFGGLTVLLAIAFSAVPVGRGNQTQLRRRLAFYSLSGTQPVKESETSTGLSATPVGRSVVGFAGRIMQSRDLETVLGRRLESAGVPLKPAEWLLLHVGTAVVLSLVLLLAFGGRLIPMIVGLVAGLVGPWAYLTVKEGRRQRDFQTQMPDALQLIAGSLSAGYSLPQAIDTVVREDQVPISTEFNRALVETRLGVPLEDALEGVADRMDSPDFRWVVMALRIQRDVGGNLAEVLGTVSNTMRERARLNRQIQVLSAEGRLSAWILCGLPVAFIVYLLLVRPEYLEPLYTTRLGVALIILSSVLLLVGALWMRRTVKVQV